jgi:hypothetical protein
MFNKKEFYNPNPKAQEDKQKEINAKIESVAEVAARCLEFDEFKKYKEMYEVLERETLRYLEEYPANVDPIKDAYQLRAVLNKLGVLKMLLRKVEKDARK